MNCVLFGPETIGTHNSTKLQRLYKLPFNAWKVAPVRFREHSEKSELHKTATTRAAMFRSFMEKKTTPVDVMLDDLTKQQIGEQKITSSHYQCYCSLWKAEYSSSRSQG